MNQAYFVVPITMVGAYGSNFTGTTVAPSTTADWARMGFKQGYFNLVHQAEFTLDGKTVEQTQSYLNQYVYCKLASQMSQDDLATFGSSMGYGSQGGLDTCSSMFYNNQGTASAAGATPAYGSTGSTAVGPVSGTNYAVTCGNVVCTHIGLGAMTQMTAGMRIQRIGKYSFLLSSSKTC